MRELNMQEVEQVGGGELTWNEGATLIMGLATAGGPTTMAFGYPIAGAMYYVSE